MSVCFSPSLSSRRWKREQQKTELMHHHHPGYIQPHSAASVYGSTPHLNQQPQPMGPATALAAANYMATLNKTGQYGGQPPRQPHLWAAQMAAVAEAMNQNIYAVGG